MPSIDVTSQRGLPANYWFWIDGLKPTPNFAECIPPSLLSQNKTCDRSETGHRPCTVPLHLLSRRSTNFASPSTSGFQAGLRRALSTRNLFREVPSQGAFRRIPAPDAEFSSPPGKGFAHNDKVQEDHTCISATTGDETASATGQNPLKSIAENVSIASNAAELTESTKDSDPAQTVRQTVSTTRQPNQEKLSVDIPSLTHLTSDGAAHMVDISEKAVTKRSAIARAVLYFSSAQTIKSLTKSTLQKGDALAVARVAAIQAAKKTADLIPLAHPGLGLTGITVRLRPFPPTRSTNTRTEDASFGGVEIRTTVSCEGKTGVEMEALTSATVAALTLYDMLKGIDKGMSINSVRVVKKQGGRSGDWTYAPKKDGMTDLVEFRNQAEAMDQTREQPIHQGSLDLDHLAAVEDDKLVEMEAQSSVEPESRHINNWANGAFTKLSREEKLAIAWKTIRIREQRVKLEKAQLDYRREALLADQRKTRLSKRDMEDEISSSVAARLRSENDAIGRQRQPSQAASQKLFPQKSKILASAIPDDDLDPTSLSAAAKMPFQPETDPDTNERSIPGFKSKAFVGERTIVYMDFKSEKSMNKRKTTAKQDESATANYDDEPNASMSSPSPADTSFSSAASTHPDVHQTSDNLGYTKQSGTNCGQESSKNRTSTAIRFDRNGMSGSFPDRANGEDFYSKRVERWEDWASKR